MDNSIPENMVKQVDETIPVDKKWLGEESVE